jgi:hypothetical protein
MQSVLQDWVIELPLREQGTLLTAVRGCDLTPKYPLDSLERKLTSAIRGAFMAAADPREIDSEPGCFMLSEPPHPREFKPSKLGHYPLHWVSHVMHASEVLAYRHPDTSLRSRWTFIYSMFCLSLHVRPETEDDFSARMNEDRIASGTVVS